MILLSKTQPGNNVSIKKVIIDGRLGQRLMDMGLYPGLEVKVIRNAPLKDPMEIEINGYLLSIRRCEAQYVEVC